jgi:hypothetical protein
LADFKLDCYVDADFAGMWGYEDIDNPTYVKSITGFVIFLMDFSIVWASKLQTDIATSTMECEYNALSIAQCETLPFATFDKGYHTWTGSNR